MKTLLLSWPTHLREQFDIRGWTAAATAFLQRHWLILVIGGLATGLRLAATPAHLPYLYTPGESIVVRQALAYGNGTLKPYSFVYPPLYSYLLFIIYGAYFVLGRLSGAFATMSEFAISYFMDPTPFYLFGRILTALMGGGTVVVVYFIGRHAYGRKTALLAASFLTFSHLHVVHSHNVLTDVPMTFLVALGAWVLLRAMDRGTPWAWIGAGFAVGLATAMKYPAALLGFTVAWGCLLWAIEDRRRGPVILGRLSLIGVGALFGFLLACPYALLDFPALRRDLFGKQLGLNQGIAKSFTETIWFYLRTLFRTGLHPFLAGVALVGLGYQFGRRRATDWALASFPLIYIPFLAMQGRYQPNWLLPALPFLAISAAVITVQLIERAVPNRRRQTLALALAALLLIAYPAWYSYFHVASSNNPDTRTLAKRWIETHLPAGTKILLDSQTTGPPLEQTVDSFVRYFEQARETKEIDQQATEARQAFGSYRQYQIEAAKRKAATEIAYNIEYMQEAWWRASEDDQDLTQVPVFGAYRERLFTLAQLQQAGIRYVVVNSFQYRDYITPEAQETWPSYYDFYHSLKEQATLVKEFHADPIHRPGPEIKIYALEAGS